MAIPAITRDQVLMLAFLAEGELSGKVLREKFAGEGVRRSGPAFYQLMARMEGEGLIAGRYGRCRIAGKPFRERLYRATEAGMSCWGAFSDFVLAHARPDRPGSSPRGVAGPLGEEVNGPPRRARPRADPPGNPAPGGPATPPRRPRSDPAANRTPASSRAPAP